MNKLIKSKECKKYDFIFCILLIFYVTVVVESNVNHDANADLLHRWTLLNLHSLMSYMALFSKYTLAYQIWNQYANMKAVKSWNVWRQSLFGLYHCNEVQTGPAIIFTIWCSEAILAIWSERLKARTSDRGTNLQTMDCRFQVFTTCAVLAPYYYLCPNRYLMIQYILFYQLYENSPQHTA